MRSTSLFRAVAAVTRTATAAAGGCGGNKSGTAATAGDAVGRPSGLPAGGDDFAAKLAAVM